MVKWVILLKAFKNGEFPNYMYGLTPRFILGACQNPIGNKFDSEQIAKSACEKMFSEMESYERENLIVTSNYCDSLNGPVLSFIDKPLNKPSIGVTFDIIWERYGNEITEGIYHINADERQTIERIFCF